MRYTNVVHEDFVNYYKPSMFIGTISCGGKCWKELGLSSGICQNDELRKHSIHVIDTRRLVEKYVENPITEAVVFGGLEPFEQIFDIYEFITILRNEFKCDDDVVIYTGYYESEVKPIIDALKEYNNIIVKFGRYIPDDKEKYDDVLRVTLSSQNQYATKIS